MAQIAWAFAESAAERILWEGRLFREGAGDGEEEDEALLLANPDATFEACAPALLLALLARTARSIVRDDVAETERWFDAYRVWESLRWAQSLCWKNLQDPLVGIALRTAVPQLQLLLSLARWPARVCNGFIGEMADLLDEAAALSLTVSRWGSENQRAYSGLMVSAAVITSYGGLLGEAVPLYSNVREIAHLFVARRLLDLKPWLANQHLQAARRLLGLRSPRGPGGGVAGGDRDRLQREIVRTVRTGLELHYHWMLEAGWTQRLAGNLPPPPGPQGAKSWAPLMVWERSLAPFFSEGMKDQVLERLFGIVGVTDRYYVEIGTQIGEQCNSRYLRVRYGFSGLMLDDNFRNPHLNHWRYYVTPSNVADIFSAHRVPPDFDLLSLDTDGNEWLLWHRLHQARFSPRVVVIEFNAELPYNEDLLVRYTAFPVHRLCLASFGRLRRLAGGSLAGVMALGHEFGYRLVHLVGSGTTDLIFVRRDVLDAAGLVFPAQDDPAGLCALAHFQSAAPEGRCSEGFKMGGASPPRSLFTTAASAIAGDYLLPETAGEPWDAARLRATFC